MIFFINLAIQDELQLFSEELYHHLTPFSFGSARKRIRFCKKKTKFTENYLATICIRVSQSTVSDSLVRLYSQLHVATGTLMSLEGLNKYFYKKAVEFLKYIFSALWKSKLCKTSAISSVALNYFQRIRILDATIVQEPKHLAYVYPGLGGCAQIVGIKIQLEYDLHTGQFLNFQVGPKKIMINHLKQIA